ncbi:SF1B family DNA helicase RecD2 [Pontiella sulfatireligans]|uniref:ATP-dependent RecD-like DNA helicase n=1 Tax=Pontiella sulfatireligans TaxID=2750658 RepID=A0A6C2UJ64_9BACT|nr:ATP-dependent RecD-like DNA helicase [Pontiella sulfatireligans]VGO20148.1 ATP-dependent RecD-like DNA helicase [Pontiella sulfatireligans]
MDKLDGQIERVVFRNEENGFCVLRVKVRGHKELITVTGTVPTVNPGEWMAGDGEWFTDPRHGRQFKAEKMRMSKPDTLEGIEKYLASDLVKGIGKEYAKRLVQTFGRDVFDVIENSSGKLLKVEGIGKGRKDNIKKAWDEQKSIRQIMAFLFSHGISTVRAFRIHKIYGEKAIEFVQRDPYCLARDIRGIGFLIADQIAMKLGIAKDSDLRARAGLEFCLGEITSNGHCAYVRNDLLSRTGELLQIDLEIIARGLDYSIEAKRLIQRADFQGRDLIYLPKLYFAEIELAKRLQTLGKGKHPCPAVDFEKALAWVQQKSGITLANAQRNALKTAVQSKVMVITGGPGVGKTTLVNSVLMVLKAKKMRVALCAPTGRAAKRMAETTGMEAKTIHRLLQFNPGTGGFVHCADKPLECDVLIVDESSMIDVVLASQLMDAVPLHAAVVIVGDADQLPSVGPGRVLQDIIRSKTIPVAHLDEVFRQAATSRIITNAHLINRGKMPEFPEEGETSDCYFVEADDPVKALALVGKMVKKSIPQKFHFNPLDDIQILTPMQKGELGARNLNVSLQQLLNPRGDEVERFGITYRTGDKVMQTENDYDKDVYNGDIGRIVSIKTEESELVVDFDGRKVVYDFRELDELVLSYAITIHKSQGSEYPCVLIPMHTQHYVLLQRSLIYTALTRAKKLVIVLGTKKALNLAVTRSESRDRTTTLSERLKEYA